MPETPILEVKSLSISFIQYAGGLKRRSLPVIRDLSLAVRAGELVAVVGASGSGKSLLAHGILHILPYNARMEGEIRYGGAPLDAGRAAALRGREIVLVPQSVNFLDPLMKVGPQLRRGKRDGDSRARARAALARYGLGAETEERYPFELSGGMARRVLISSAVLDAPRLVVADEPTPGLDGPTARRVLGHFRELADAGAGVLLITHDLELAISCADRVVIFYAGTTVEEAAAADFGAEAALRHPYTRALWRAMPEHGFEPLSGTQPYAGDLGAGCPFAGRCPSRRADCAAGEIPSRPLRGGAVRCLHPEGTP